MVGIAKQTRMNSTGNPSSRLAGKVAWISGGNSGIGEATARLFAREGAHVALLGRRLEPGEKIAAEIRAEGGEAMALAADVSDEKQVRDSIEKTVSRFGRIDILINNAGMVALKPLHESSAADWDRIMDVNVKSMFLAFHAAYPHLAKQPRSWVVNVGSISSFVGQSETPIYTTSKHAILGLTRSIALDYARDGLRCNCVCPGITDTPMLREHLETTPDPETTLAGRLQRVPMGVALTPMDVAKSILFFSCDDSSGVTGSSLVVDGGYLAAAEWESSDGTTFQNQNTSS